MRFSKIGGVMKPLFELMRRSAGNFRPAAFCQRPAFSTPEGRGQGVIVLTPLDSVKHFLPEPRKILVRLYSWVFAIASRVAIR